MNELSYQQTESPHLIDEITLQDSIKTTLDSKTYKVLLLKSELYCLCCKPHEGCNLNNKKIHSGREHISWKVVYKDKKQWMKSRHSNRDLYY